MTSALQPRYAVYYAPPKDSALWACAQRWLGRDCESGQTLDQTVPKGWTEADIAAATRSPRHYGFHATLKAPFRLAPQTSIRDLHQRLTAFAAAQQPFEAPPLEVSAIGPFLALTLSAPSPRMEALAAVAVQQLDELRAPLQEDELQRRLGSGLTTRQEDYLRAWGYPYVLEEFRFHMTLSGPLDPAPRERLRASLTELFRPHTTTPFKVGEICLYSQNQRDEPFYLVDRLRLGLRRVQEANERQQGEIAE